MNEMITTTGRSIATVTTEIRTITKQAQNMILQYAVEIGTRLIEAKELVPYGEWGEYLKNEVEFSQSTANNFMRLAKEYGEAGGLFGNAANLQALGNLNYTQALRLLAIPAEERQEFAEEHKVEDLSTRELDKLIKQVEEERAAREQAQQDVKAADDAAAETKKKLEKAEQAEAAAQKTAEKLQKELEKAKEAEKKAKAEAEKLKASPEIPETIMEQLRRDAEAEAAKSARAEAEAKVQEARAAAEKAAKEKAEAEAKLAAAQKANQLANPDVAVFQALFQQVQQDFNRLQGVLLKVEAQDPAMAGKLKAAMKALIDKLGKEAM